MHEQATRSQQTCRQGRRCSESRQNMPRDLGGARPIWSPQGAGSSQVVGQSRGWQAIRVVAAASALCVLHQTSKVGRRVGCAKCRQGCRPPWVVGCSIFQLMVEGLAGLARHAQFARLAMRSLLGRSRLMIESPRYSFGSAVVTAVGGGYRLCWCSASAPSSCDAPDNFIVAALACLAQAARGLRLESPRGPIRGCH